MRHIWATTGPGVKSRENAAFGSAKRGPTPMVHDPLTI